MDPFIGEIRIFAGTYAPDGWVLCNGSLLPIVQYTALYAVIGNRYGGDGRTNFAVPNLQGRAPMQYGQGPGLTNRPIAVPGGAATVGLSTAQMPSHTHVPHCLDVLGSEESPVGRVWAAQDERSATAVYAATPDADMNAQAIGPAGGAGQPHNNLQPRLALNFIIATTGIFPPRQ